MTDTQVKPYTAEDLNRDYATGPWCTECQGFGDQPCKNETCLTLYKPPLWERCPAARPTDPAIFYCHEDGHWWSEDEMGPLHIYQLHEAADRCVMGVVEAVPRDDLVAFWQEVVNLLYVVPHRPHAVAIAKHRNLDAVEAAA